MEEIGRYAMFKLPGLGARGVITEMDWQAIYGLWVAMAVLLFLAWSVTRKLERHPGRLQYLFEVIVEAFDGLCRDSMGEGGRKYVSFVGSTFLLLLACNWMGAIPGMIEPTKNINTNLGIALVGFIYTLIEAVRMSGPIGYIKGLAEPYLFMFPMNVIGEAAKVVSLSCRLFGNIMGGAIIIEVVSHLCAYILAPMGLVAYFGLAVGLIQAFVFTMLTLTYLAIAVGDDEEEAAA